MSVPKKKNPREAELKKRVAKLTTKPGVYRWLDARGGVLYIGKAKNLRNRVRTYLQKDAALGPWKQSLMSKVADLSVTVTNSELEALILETNLIRQKKPKYNVLMKDDKNYVYVRISLGDPFPRLDLVRRPTKDGAQYFGPYLSAFEIREMLTLLRKVFPYRNCKMEIAVADSGQPFEGPEGLSGPNGRTADSGKKAFLGPKSEARSPVSVVVTHRDRPTPCLDYHIKQCSAPCIGRVTPEQYRRESIEGVVDFLKGRTEDAIALLSERMRAAAADRKFEQAAKLRDALKTIERLREKQIVSDTSGEDADIFGVAVESNRVHVVLLKERNGKVIDESAFTLVGHAESAAEALEQFLPQYYVDAPDVPPLLVLAEDLEERPLLEKWLTQMRGTRVAIAVPERGKKGKLLLLAEENVREKVSAFETKWEAAARNVEDALKELKDTLTLPATPKRIEAYDISHLGGTETVGSMSVFVDGKPKNDQYRSFTLKTLADREVDDYRALQEVLKRRLRHLQHDIRRGEQELKKCGITLRKSRKTDLRTIGKIIAAHPQEIDDRDIRSGGFLLAEQEKKIIAFCRLYVHKDKTLELAALFVDEQMRGRRLGHLLARKLLKPLKKGKVYIEIHPKLQEYYAELGFRPVHTAPAPIVAKAKRCQKSFRDKVSALFMMFDVKGNAADPSLRTIPDLLLLDGGKGQLSAGLAVLRELTLSIPVIALAKKEEEIFAPGSQKPITFAKDSPARFLLMRLRDEAHRFANTHREARLKKRAVFSAIDALPGIGPQTRVKLLRRFGSLEAVRAASDTELLKILSQSQLKTFRDQL